MGGGDMWDGGCMKWVVEKKKAGLIGLFELAKL